MAPRDQFIGWNAAQREARLHLVINNARFLILPWVQVRNARSSCVLARIAKRLAHDWQARYGYHPVLVETFVQSRALRRHQLPRRQLDPAWVRPKAAANWTSTTNTLCPRRTSGSIPSDETSAADSVPL